jgi:hypothetical protein
MPLDRTVAKKSYRSPSVVKLDLSAVKAKLEADRDPTDSDALKMLSIVDKQLNQQKAKPH